MKSYPSILRHNDLNRAAAKILQEEDVDLFDKIDGSNLRWEWDRAKGWVKQGTRNRLFDETDLVFGEAIPLFHETLGKPLAVIAKNLRAERAIFYTEFWGPSSFAGTHVAGEPKNLTLFDITVYKKGLLGPRAFRDATQEVLNYTPRYLGKHRWTRELVDEVRRGLFPGVTFEGVVGKHGEGQSVVLVKAKTQAWIDKVTSALGAGAADS